VPTQRHRNNKKKRKDEGIMPNNIWNPIRAAATGLAMLFIAGAPAFAQKVPNAFTQEVVIKATLLSFNDANVTGNYTVFHAKVAKAFRDQHGPDKFATAFKVFHEKRIDFDIIAAKTPVSTSEAKIDDRGVLNLRGYFPTEPSRVNYDLDFVMSDGEWKLLRIDVNVKKPD
jgi:hypothetical protein